MVLVAKKRSQLDPVNLATGNRDIHTYDSKPTDIWQQTGPTVILCGSPLKLYSNMNKALARNDKLCT